MLLSRFTEQTELAEVYKQYTLAYEALGHDVGPWGVFDDFRVLKARDNVGVFYTPETTLFGDAPQKRQEESAVAKNIVNRLLDCATYFLAQDIPVALIPEKLRLCLAVCHDNTHWTGLIATVSFKEAYQKLFEAWKLYKATLEEGLDASQLRPWAERAVLDVIGGSDPKQLLRFFQEENKLMIEHYDSMNADYYTQRVQQSLHNIAELCELKSCPCSQQQGNTCGDHTTINLFVSGMMNTLPRINQQDSIITSHDLREITDSVAHSDNSERVKTILSGIPLPNVEPAVELPPDEEWMLVKRCNAVVDEVYNLINEFYALNPQETTRMVHLAICQATNVPLNEDFQLEDHQRDIFKKLILRFTDDPSQETHPLPYAALARLVAKDYMAEIEHQRLLETEEASQKKLQEDMQEQEEKIDNRMQKENLADGRKQEAEIDKLMQYETIFTTLKTEIERKIANFNAYKKLTQNKYPWDLGWGGSRSRIQKDGVEYCVPKTIHEIYSKISSYEESKSSLPSPELQLKAHTLFSEIAETLEAKKKTNPRGMLGALYDFFKNLVSAVFGYRRSEETEQTYEHFSNIMHRK